LIWQQDDQSIAAIPSPIGHGWIAENEQLIPVMCDIECAPASILELIKCSCKKNRCRPPCKCLENNLPCTEMCRCNDDEGNCDNVSSNCEEQDDSLDEDYSDISDDDQEAHL
jgi:hypothetical protein